MPKLRFDKIICQPPDKNIYFLLVRKIFNLLLIAGLLIFLFLEKDKIVYNVNFLLASPCDKPITYQIGEVDKGYGLTPPQFLEKVEEANRIWSAVVGKNLFANEPNGEITISLIYSERQSMADSLNQLEQDLKSGKKSLDLSITEYKKLQADFSQKLEAFNQEVDLWNKRGGAPEDVFSQLINQQNKLKSEADRLNNMASQLNLSVEQYNLGVSQFNQGAQNFNQAIIDKPEAGIYQGSLGKIDIYLTSSDTELIHTLAHEMGHAWGLNHISDPQSITYPMTSEVIQPDSQETETLQTYCQQRNWEIVLNTVENNLSDKINQVKNEFE